jgi:lipopolysaccharide transport system ATP-binding protein
LEENHRTFHKQQNTIEEGDKVALLGRNGAGKSTFLKILSRITPPTTGTIKVRGKVSSLLEVGAGFHPELTGRENIFLNGAIMGMKYREIIAKFDEIVAFADVENFLDIPIKKYSTGMFTRLGFSIAVHLDSEIMIIDEVLAVGDGPFQEKCIKKLHEIGKKNRTILFVSHSIPSVLALCNKGVYLENGRLQAFESIETCVSRYTRNCPLAGLEWEGNVGDEHIRITRCFLQPSSSSHDFFYHEESSQLIVDFEILEPASDLLLGFSILNSLHQSIARSRLCDHAEHRSVVLSKGRHQLSFDLHLDDFHPGEYQIRLECSLLHKKQILQGEILLAFAVYSHDKQIQLDHGFHKEGISLGNRWKLT